MLSTKGSFGTSNDSLTKGRTRDWWEWCCTAFLAAGQRKALQGLAGTTVVEAFVRGAQLDAPCQDSMVRYRAPLGPEVLCGLGLFFRMCLSTYAWRGSMLRLRPKGATRGGWAVILNFSFGQPRRWSFWTTRGRWSGGLCCVAVRIPAVGEDSEECAGCGADRDHQKRV